MMGIVSDPGSVIVSSSSASESSSLRGPKSSIWDSIVPADFWPLWALALLHRKKNAHKKVAA